MHTQLQSQAMLDTGTNRFNPTRSSPALVLNADFRPVSLFPLSLVSWQEAVSAVVCDRVHVVAEYDAWVRSPSMRMRLPSVIALRTYARRVQRVAFTRFNVFLRDRFTCQYCGAVLPASQLTFDHVVPRVRGGTTCWENVVAACMPCNTAKGCAMRLTPRVAPRKPAVRELLAARRAYPPDILHSSWIDYLYWDVALEA
jgi:5-methylcytosine-specific restriction endonuclease McrA